MRLQSTAISPQPGQRADIRLFTLYPLAFGGVLVLLVKSALIDNDLALLERFSISTLSLCVEALPFLLLGSLLSAAIHLFVSDAWLQRLIPRSRFFGVVIAALLGFALPVCDCGSVPVTRRLLAKGVPLHAGVAFLLSVPAVNPLVIVSTLFAFSQKPVFVVYRIGFSFITAVVIGLLMSFLDARYFLRDQPETAPDGEGHGPSQPRTGALHRVGELLTHAGDDFFDMGRFFLAGVLISSFLQTVVPVSALAFIGHNPMLSVPVMIAGAFLLSVCSQADAFIAQAFMAQFSTGALVAFLVFGPMLDMKNTLMLLPVLRGRLVALLVAMAAGICLVIGLWLNLGPAGGGP